jgi:hypothetical protein
MPTNFPTGVDNFTNPTANDSLNLPSHSTQHANTNDAIEAVEDYLLNGDGKSGLVLLKTQAVGTAVSSVNVTSAFNATYDNYKIIYHNGASSVATPLNLRLGASTTAYYGSYVYAAYSTGVVAGLGVNNGSSFVYAGAVAGGSVNLNADVFSPFLAKFTTLTSVGTNYSFNFGNFTGTHEVATSYSDFTLTPSSGTLTGGTIYVYGYRKA